LLFIRTVFTFTFYFDIIVIHSFTLFCLFISCYFYLTIVIYLTFVHSFIDVVHIVHSSMIREFLDTFLLLFDIIHRRYHSVIPRWLVHLFVTYDIDDLSVFIYFDICCPRDYSFHLTAFTISTSMTILLPHSFTLHHVHLQSVMILLIVILFWYCPHWLLLLWRYIDLILLLFDIPRPILWLWTFCYSFLIPTFIPSLFDDPIVDIHFDLLFWPHLTPHLFPLIHSSHSHYDVHLILHSDDTISLLRVVDTFSLHLHSIHYTIIPFWWFVVIHSRWSFHFLFCYCWYHCYIDRYSDDIHCSIIRPFHSLLFCCYCCPVLLTVFIDIIVIVDIIHCCVVYWLLFYWLWLFIWYIPHSISCHCCYCWSFICRWYIPFYIPHSFCSPIQFIDHYWPHTLRCYHLLRSRRVHSCTTFSQWPSDQWWVLLLPFWRLLFLPVDVEISAFIVIPFIHSIVIGTLWPTFIHISFPDTFIHIHYILFPFIVDWYIHWKSPFPVVDSSFCWFILPLPHLHSFLLSIHRIHTYISHTFVHLHFSSFSFLDAVFVALFSFHTIFYSVWYIRRHLHSFRWLRSTIPSTFLRFTFCSHSFWWSWPVIIPPLIHSFGITMIQSYIHLPHLFIHIAMPFYIHCIADDLRWYHSSFDHSISSWGVVIHWRSWRWLLTDSLRRYSDDVYSFGTMTSFIYWLFRYIWYSRYVVTFDRYSALIFGILTCYSVFYGIDDWNTLTIHYIQWLFGNRLTDSLPIRWHSFWCDWSYSLFIVDIPMLTDDIQYSFYPDWHWYSFWWYSDICPIDRNVLWSVIDWPLPFDDMIFIVDMTDIHSISLIRYLFIRYSTVLTLFIDDTILTIQWPYRYRIQYWWYSLWYLMTDIHSDVTIVVTILFPLFHWYHCWCHSAVIPIFIDIHWLIRCIVHSIHLLFWLAGSHCYSIVTMSLIVPIPYISHSLLMPFDIHWLHLSFHSSFLICLMTTFIWYSFPHCLFIYKSDIDVIHCYIALLHSILIHSYIIIDIHSFWPSFWFRWPLIFIDTLLIYSWFYLHYDLMIFIDTLFICELFIVDTLFILFILRVDCYWHSFWWYILIILTFIHSFDDTFLLHSFIWCWYSCLYSISLPTFIHTLLYIRLFSTTFDGNSYIPRFSLPLPTLRCCWCHSSFTHSAFVHILTSYIFSYIHTFYIHSRCSCLHLLGVVLHVSFRKFSIIYSLYSFLLIHSFFIIIDAIIHYSWYLFWYIIPFSILMTIHLTIHCWWLFWWWLCYLCWSFIYSFDIDTSLRCCPVMLFI